MPGVSPATIELAPGTSHDEETAPLTGAYEINPARFVVEPVIRILRLPALRGRFSCAGGQLVLGAEPELVLELRTRSLRTNVPGLARTLTGKGGLCAPRFPLVRFQSTAMTVEPDSTAEVIGNLDVLDVSRKLRLAGRVIRADEFTVVVWLSGRLRPPRRPLASGYWLAQLIGERTMHIELAAEFVR